MTSSAVRARAFLSRLGSVPLEPEAALDFLQRRLRVLADCCFWFASVTWAINALLNALFFSDFSGGYVFSARSLVHGATAIVWGFVSIALRRIRLSAAALAWLDVVSTEAMALGFAAMVRLGDARLRSDMVMSMAVGHLLVLRAAILPSTGRRTAAIGAIAELFIVIAAYLLHASSAPFASGTAPEPASVAAALVVWAALAIATTTLISSVIYGLSERVREAMRLGQYSLEEKLGEGGMGVVYRAKHSLLRRPTAIKLLSSPHATEAQIARFAREVQSTAKLSHSNIVTIYDYGRSATGVFYYAMEYVDGIDLDRLVHKDGPQSDGRVREILRQAADALAEAHAAGLIHRDVKPSNMILTESRRRPEQVKLVDFGLVKEVDADSTCASGVFDIKGTPLYLAPESITAPTSVDARTDLYSLGAVGYFLLTGTPVFEAPSVVEVCGMHMYAAVIPPSKRVARPVSAKLERVVLACLAKSPAERPQSAAALIEQLDECDDCTAFTEDDARRWWSERAQKPRASHAEGGASSPSAILRMGVDPRGRS